MGHTPARVCVCVRVLPWDHLSAEVGVSEGRQSAIFSVFLIPEGGGQGGGGVATWTLRGSCFFWVTLM